MDKYIKTISIQKEKEVETSFGAKIRISCRLSEVVPGLFESSRSIALLDNLLNETISEITREIINSLAEGGDESGKTSS